MKRYQETFRTWDKVASMYEEKFMEMKIYDDTYDLFLSLIPPKSKVLELGCGPGNIAKYLLNRRKDISLLGIDISQQMVTLAKKNNPQAQFDILDTRYIDRLDGKFDAVIAGFCLPYLSELDRKKLFIDIFNLLHQGGICYVSFVSGKYEDSGFITGSTGDRMYFYYHPKKMLIQEVVNIGFEVLHNIQVLYKENEKHDILILKV